MSMLIQKDEVSLFRLYVDSELKDIDTYNDLHKQHMEEVNACDLVLNKIKEKRNNYFGISWLTNLTRNYHFLIKMN